MGRTRRARRVCVLLSIVTLSVLTPAIAQAKTYAFKGRGWGHGLGMAQWGARGLAAKGMSASQILKRYYTKTTVKKKSLPGSIRVGLLQERNEIWVEGNGRFDLHDRVGKRRASGDADGRWRVVPDGDRLEVYAPGASKPKFSTGVPVTVRWEQHGTLLDLPQTGYRYKRGRMDVDINPSTGKTRAILILGFEEYLYGLGEMPSSWHTEALEAQAMAGRTYALEKVLRVGQKRSVCNCGVYATVADQAYVGVSHEVERWVDAVKKTAGLVVTYKDKPIQAYYSSSSGGYTESNEKVWGGDPLPYLRAVCDPGDYYNGKNPHSNWTVKMEDTEIASRMSDAGRNVGLVSDIDYLSPRGKSGRLLSVIDSNSGGVRVEGPLGDERMSGGTFRSILDLKSTLIHHHIDGKIRKRYDALSCKPGLPKAGDFTWKDLDKTPRGRAQDFVSGRIFYNSTTTKKVWWVRGQILAYYDALRRKGKDFGLPASHNIALDGGKAGHFERGHIYWSSKTGGHEVHGAILSKYLDSGGYKKWGFPTSDELKASGGRWHKFEKCRIYWSSKYGAHPVYGAILEKYIELDGTSGKLGLPKSDEYAVNGGRRQDFAHGYIRWNSETGATKHRITD